MLTGKVINNAETVFFPVTDMSKAVMSYKIFGKISDVRTFSAAHIFSVRIKQYGSLMKNQECLSYEIQTVKNLIYWL
jgi:hypothetical protein